MNSELLYHMSIIMTDFVGIVLCYYFFDHYLQKNHYKKIYNILFVIGIIIVLIVTNNMVKQPVLFVLSAMVVYSVVVLHSFRGNLLIRLLSGLFFVVIGVITESVTVLIVSVIFKISIDENMDNDSIYILGLIISKLLMIIIIRIIVIMTKKKHNDMPIRYSGLMLTIPVVSIYIVMIIMHKTIFNLTSYLNSIGSVLGLLYINLIVFGIIDVIISKTEENREYRCANQQLSIQQEHYKNIIEGYKTTRGLWHDMKNNVISIYTFIDNEEYDLAKLAIEKIDKDLANAMKEVISGNMIIDAILNSKKMIAKKQAISIDIDTVVPKVIKVDPIDLCVIIGNTIDNAIEACIRNEEKHEEKRIEVILHYEKESLLLSVTNPVDMRSICIKNNKYLSSKSNNKHQGYGIHNIKRAVDKYGGNVMVHIKESNFMMEIIIPIDKNRQ